MASKLTRSSTLKLNSGYEIPLLGYGVGGVYKTLNDEATKVCTEALKLGYRHIDSASGYRNQGPSAAAISASGVPREQVFFTTKVPNKNKPPFTYEGITDVVNAALDETKLTYLDLVLIHWPQGGGPDARKAAWRALVDAVEAGKVRSIGVSNYGIHHLEELEAYIKELEAERGPGKGGVISVGQWEVHPWLTRNDIVKWCRDRNIAVQAFAPILRGTRFDDPKLVALAEKYGRTPAQILIRWSLQRGYVPLVKSVTSSRIKENIEAFDFELTDAEVEDLATNEYSPCAWDPTTTTLEQ